MTGAGASFRRLVQTLARVLAYIDSSYWLALRRPYNLWQIKLTSKLKTIVMHS